MIDKAVAQKVLKEYANNNVSKSSLKYIETGVHCLVSHLADIRGTLITEADDCTGALSGWECNTETQMDCVELLDYPRTMQGVKSFLSLQAQHPETFNKRIISKLEFISNRRTGVGA